MNRRIATVWMRILALVGLTLSLSSGPLSPISVAQIYNPPDRGLPGRREGGGTRGNCVSSQPNLTALIPVTHYGQTTQPHPTLFWYVPQTTATIAEFELQDGNTGNIYTVQLAAPTEPGIIQLNFSEFDSLPPLEAGQPYHWYFALVCDPLDRSGDVITEGWIERVDADATGGTPIDRATGVDRAILEAEAGLWHDALMTLAEFYSTEPTNPQGIQGWQQLLDSVELGEFADQPLLDCCNRNDAPSEEQ